MGANGLRGHGVRGRPTRVAGSKNLWTIFKWLLARPEIGAIFSMSDAVSPNLSFQKTETLKWRAAYGFPERSSPKLRFPVARADRSPSKLGIPPDFACPNDRRSLIPFQQSPAWVATAGNPGGSALPPGNLSNAFPGRFVVRLNQYGAFDIIAYADTKGDGNYLHGTVLRVFHLAIVGMQQPTVTVIPTPDFAASVTPANGSLTFNSSVSTTGNCIRETAGKVALIGGGPGGTIGTDQMEIGWLQNLTGDTAAMTYIYVVDWRVAWSASGTGSGDSAVFSTTGSTVTVPSQHALAGGGLIPGTGTPTAEDAITDPDFTYIGN